MIRRRRWELSPPQIWTGEKEGKRRVNEVEKKKMRYTLKMSRKRAGEGSEMKMKKKMDPHGKSENAGS